MIGIGDVVVCVDDAPPRNRDVCYRLAKGALYRVTDAFSAPNGDQAILVDGEPPHYVWDGMSGWDIRRFKPLRKADASFTALIKRRRRVTNKEPVA